MSNKTQFDVEIAAARERSVHSVRAMFSILALLGVLTALVAHYFAVTDSHAALNSEAITQTSVTAGMARGLLFLSAGSLIVLYLWERTFRIWRS